MAALGTPRRLLRPFLPAHVRRDRRDTELLRRLLAAELAPDSDCIDVGAHAGDVLELIRRHAPRGRHVAWEPLPGFAQRLRMRFPHVEVRAAALGDEPGLRDFAHVVADPGWSGFVDRTSPRGGPVEQIRVPVERLDDVLPEGVEPALVKIDVEGAEEEVLRGARETLARFAPVVVFEHGQGSADLHGSSPEAVWDLLDGLGYRVHGLDGDGPYDRARFGAIFRAEERVNFVARR